MKLSGIEEFDEVPLRVALPVESPTPRQLKAMQLNPIACKLRAIPIISDMFPPKMLQREHLADSEDSGEKFACIDARVRVHEDGQGQCAAG